MFGVANRLWPFSTSESFSIPTCHQVSRVGILDR